MLYVFHDLSATCLINCSVFLINPCSTLCYHLHLFWGGGGMRYIIVYSMYHSCVAEGQAGPVGGVGGRRWLGGWAGGTCGVAWIRLNDRFTE